MAIVVKNTKITEEIVNEKGELLGHISYDPEDYNSYKEILNIMEDIYALDDALKVTNSVDVKAIEEAAKNEDFDSVRSQFHTMADAMNKGSESIDSIIKRIDTIFGTGTCKIILNGTYNLNLLLPLLEAVTPQFEKLHSEKKNAYLEGIKENVME